MSQIRFLKPKTGWIFVPNKSKNEMSTLVKLLIIVLLNTAFVNAQDVKTLDIEVKIHGLDNSDGKLLVGLYNAEDAFLKKQFMGNVTTISDKKGTIIFKDVPEGIYAVSFVHDENDNGKMDTNFMGIPKEDYGCSNNAKGFMGPPKWKDAKFELKGENKTITITL